MCYEKYRVLPAALNPDCSCVFREDFSEGVASKLRPEKPVGVS